MRNQRMNMFYCLIILLMVGCTGETKPPFSSTQQIQQLLDNYPDIHRELVYLKVTNYEKGIITIDIIDAERPLAKVIMEKTPLKDIGDDPLSKNIRNIDNILKQHQGVNQVIFTATCLNEYKKWKVKDDYLEKASDQEKEQFFRQLIKEYPNSLTKPYKILAQLAGQRKATALQEEYLKKALEVNPNQAEIINDLCWFYYTENRNLQWASDKMVQVLKLFPNFAHGYNTYGAILLNMGEPEKAIVNLEKALKLRDEHDEEYKAADQYLLAISYARTGNRTAAQEALDKAVTLRPNDEIRKEAEKEVNRN